MTTTPTPPQVLACPMTDNDAGADTIREYLVVLLASVWHGREGFSGKRPFGNSGWEYELYGALADAGWIDCTRDSDGDITTVDKRAGDKFIDSAIKALGA